MLHAADLRARFAIAIAAALVPNCKPASTDATPGGEPTTTVDLVPTGTSMPTNVTPVPTTPGATTTTGADEGPPPPKSTKTVQREALGGGFWSLEKIAPPPTTPGPPVRPIMGACPNASYCVRAPKAAPGTPAPLPYETCAATAAPPNQPDGQIQFSPELTKEERTLESTACCYHWFILCPGGRPLHAEGGDTIVARVVDRADWATCATRAAEEPSSALRSRVAEHWAREAAFEHASVASFSVTSLELAALGAPAELLAGAHLAALDEIEHAKLCFELAARYGGAELGPGPLPLGRLDVASDARTIALKTLRDACLNETVASLVAASAAEHAQDDRARAVLETIASDEARHAELGWRTLAWIARTFDVGDALALELDALRSDPSRARERTASEDTALRRHGVLSHDEQARIRASAVSEVVVPCLEALLASATARTTPAHARACES